MIKLVYEINGNDVDAYTLTQDYDLALAQVVTHTLTIADYYGVALHDVTLRFVQEDKVK